MDMTSVKIKNLFSFKFKIIKILLCITNIIISFLSYSTSGEIYNIFEQKEKKEKSE